jgi:hypothetical protein
MENPKSKNEEFTEQQGKMGWFYISSILEAQRNFMNEMQKTMMYQKPDEMFNLWQEWSSYVTEWAQNFLKVQEQMQKAASDQYNPWRAWSSIATELTQNYLSFWTKMIQPAKKEQPSAAAASSEMWQGWNSYTANCAQNFQKFLSLMQKAATGQV